MKLATVSLLGTTLVFAGTSVWLARELGATRDALAAESDARAAQEVRLRELERTPPPSREVEFADNRARGEDDVGAESSAARGDPVGPPASPSETRPGPPGPNVGTRGATGRELSPAELRQRRVAQETRLRRQFEEMPGELGLDAATADRLFDLLADQEMATMEQMRAYAGDPAGRRAVADAARRDRDAAIDALIGPDKAADFVSFEKSLPARMQVGRIAADMTASDVPLREEQRKQMIDTIAGIQEKHPQPTRDAASSAADFEVRRLDWQADYSKRVQAAVEPVLTSEQRARYREAVDLQNARRAASRARAQARRENGER
jgi:hypothetical protein